VIFVFASIDVFYYIYRFTYFEPPLHPWNEANLVFVIDLSGMLLDSVCHYFIEDFYVDIHKGNWPIVLIFGGIFVWF
jgi:hypothetical protein